MVDLPTWMVDLYGKSIGKYTNPMDVIGIGDSRSQNHGSSGSANHLSGTNSMSVQTELNSFPNLGFVWNPMGCHLKPPIFTEKICFVGSIFFRFAIVVWVAKIQEMQVAFLFGDQLVKTSKDEMWSWKRLAAKKTRKLRCSLKIWWFGA